MLAVIIAVSFGTVYLVGKNEELVIQVSPGSTSFRINELTKPVPITR